jgi:GGDEF domain-containing protein
LGDVLGRWSGDEFLVISRNVTESFLKHLAECCGHLIDATFVPADWGAPIRTNVSVGATVLREVNWYGASLDRTERPRHEIKGDEKNRVHFG